jgi:hypothetical protein
MVQAAANGAAVEEFRFPVVQSPSRAEP